MSSRANAAKNSSVLSKPAFAATASSLSARAAEARELALDQRAALRDRLLVLLRLEPLAHLRARAVAVDVAQLRVEPVARRPALLRRDDLDPLPVRQLIVERHHLAVDLGAAAAMAEPGVNGVREVDRRRAARQVDHLALRRQHVDRIGEQAFLERREPLARVRDRVLPVEHLAQPRDLLVERRVVRARPCRRLPCSASATRRRTRECWCISRVRICTSSGLPSGPITAVCSER